MSVGQTKLTYREYACFPDDGKRHEVIDGEHSVNPTPSTYHQTVSRLIQYQLFSQIELTGGGQVFNAPVDVQLTPHDIVQPDLVIVTDRRIITPSKIKGIPDVVVEIVSPSTEQNHRVLKRLLYEKVGIPGYWIVDPFEHEIERLRLVEGKDDATSHADAITCGDFDPPVSVDLSNVW